MTDHPMNFNTDMVRALLAGRKTQHRVVLKGQPGRWVMGGDVLPCRPVIKWWGRSALWPWSKAVTETHSPYAIGDRLWVRECFAEVGHVDPQWVLYRASGYGEECIRHGFDPKSIPPESKAPWKSGALMPRHLSRLTLIVTDVRVQRLQEISEADAIAEGCRPFFDKDDEEMVPTGNGGHIPMMPLKGPVDAFHKAWNTIRAKRPEHQWKANPWVCALTFYVVKANIDEVEL